MLCLATLSRRQQSYESLRKLATELTKYLTIMGGSKWLLPSTVILTILLAWQRHSRFALGWLCAVTCTAALVLSRCFFARHENCHAGSVVPFCSGCRASSTDRRILGVGECALGFGGRSRLRSGTIRKPRHAEIRVYKDWRADINGTPDFHFPCTMHNNRVAKC